MSTGELIQFAALAAIVMIIAYVARRSQTVGLPPGVAKEEAPDGEASDGKETAEDRTRRPDNPNGKAGRSGKSKR